MRVVWSCVVSPVRYEAINPQTADNVMQFTIEPYVAGDAVPTCPEGLQSTLFHYCYYADNGEFEVTMTGRLITNALNATNTSYWVTAIDGVRTQRDATRVQVTQAYDMTWQQDSGGQHNNRLFQSQPYIDSYLGVTLNLAVNDVNNSHGGQRELALLGSPPREYWVPPVNDTLAASKAPTLSYFIYQVGAAPSCPMKAERAALLQQWSFQYVIRSPSMQWAVTCSGSLTVLGPYQQSLAPSRTVYVVVHASGTRTYTDSAGVDHVSQIVGLANATLTAASQLLYVGATNDSYVPTSWVWRSCSATWQSSQASCHPLICGSAVRTSLPCARRRALASPTVMTRHWVASLTRRTRSACRSTPAVPRGRRAASLSTATVSASCTEAAANGS